MICLLDSNFTRLRKNKLLYLLLGFSVVVALLMLGTSYVDMTMYGRTIETEQLMLNYATMIGVVVSIFTSLFVGAEYADGGNRNKVIVGNKRICIYLANLIVTSLTSVLSYLVFLLVIALVGIPLFGQISVSLGNLLGYIGCILVMILGNSSLFTFIAMLVSNRTLSAVMCIMLAFGMMMSGLALLSRIQAPEYLDMAQMNSDKGGFEIVKEKNPKYLTEEQRKVYMHVLKFIPAGQAFLLAGRMETGFSSLPFYSLGIIVIFTGIGLVLFNKKELK